MKTKWRILTSALVFCVAVIACENNDQDLTMEDEILKKANNGMIKSYGNEMVLKWNQALSMAVDQKMPIAMEARIYAMFSLAGAEKSYTSFSDYAHDVALSRIYAGFQFRNDVEAGDKMGRELARFIYFRKFRDI